MINAATRNTFMNMLQAAKAAYDKGSTKIVIDKSASGIRNERLAYVNITNYGLFQVKESSIHLTPLFFTASNNDNEKSDTLIHEMGRLYNNLYQTGTGDLRKDVTVWDGIINILNANYDLIIQD